MKAWIHTLVHGVASVFGNHQLCARAFPWLLCLRFCLTLERPDVLFKTNITLYVWLTLKSIWDYGIINQYDPMFMMVSLVRWAKELKTKLAVSVELGKKITTLDLFLFRLKSISVQAFMSTHWLGSGSADYLFLFSRETYIWQSSVPKWNTMPYFLN